MTPPGDDDGIDAPAGDFVCESGGTTFPVFDKSCGTVDDCFIAVHQINCCGTQVAVGFNRNSEAAFASAEPQCAGAFPGCGCPSLPTTAEDGRSESDGLIQVRCDLDQQCRTFVP